MLGTRACGEAISTPSPPIRRRERPPLSAEQRQENRVLAYTQQGTLHVIRHIKIFRVLKGVYRHRRRRFALRVQLIAALCNLTHACRSWLLQEVQYKNPAQLLKTRK
ncbi:transposase family protein [Deinococcus hopiensis]|uniref:transposase family protein n=1 Tax=Deinococcus hopiensis TaxID=309885 RepID=UPI002481ACDC|nr:transposase family protein [Deinococcus hopiensis]